MKRRAGYTMVEVMISILLTAVMVSAVFTVALTGQSQSNKVDRHVLANQYSRHLTETLAQYTTADWTTSSIAGPASTTPGAASWYLNGITGEDGRTVQDDCGTCAPATACTSQTGCNFGSSCYALTGGTHTIRGFVPAWFEASPFSACVQYYASPTTVGVSTGNIATVTINWTEP